MHLYCISHLKITLLLKKLFLLISLTFLEGAKFIMFVYFNPLLIFAEVFHCKLHEKFPILPQYLQRYTNLVAVFQLRCLFQATC